MEALTHATLVGNVFGRDVSMFQLGKVMTSVVHDLNSLGYRVQVVRDSEGSIRISRVWKDGDDNGLAQAVLELRKD